MLKFMQGTNITMLLMQKLGTFMLASFKYLILSM